MKKLLLGMLILASIGLSSPAASQASLPMEAANGTEIRFTPDFSDGNHEFVAPEIKVKMVTHKVTGRLTVRRYAEEPTAYFLVVEATYRASSWADFNEMDYGYIPRQRLTTLDRSSTNCSGAMCDRNELVGVKLTRDQVYGGARDKKWFSFYSRDGRQIVIEIPLAHLIALDEIAQEIENR